MKVITIGRSSENDVRINDPKVSRHHLQIVQHDDGSFSLADFGSLNGTFVNGQPVQGEIQLNSNDTIRIGNSTLAWKRYFSSTLQGDKKIDKTIKIGRGPGNNIYVDDPKVSRIHCQIVCYSDSTYVLEDLGSANGTYVNGSLINRRTSLRRGDKIQIGNTFPLWENYIDPNGTEIGTGPNIGTDIGESDENENSATATGIWTLLIGLASLGCIGYIVINYFTSFGQKLVSAIGGAGATLKYFPIYLHGSLFSSGQWGLMIAAVVLGVLTDLIDFLTGEKEDKLASAGRWLGNTGVTIGGIFLVLAILAEKIVQIY